MMDDFQVSLLESLQFGFINAQKYADKTYAPRVLVNNPDENKYVITDIDEELRRCDSFQFSVAFVTQSGIGLIKTQLRDLAARGVRGKIIISPYLDFNDPLALRDLLKLTNVDVRMSPPELQLHAKYYMFERAGQKVIISGSSNLTANALKKNYEWNIKLTSSEHGDLIQRTNEEFERIWKMSEPLTEALIDAYKANRKPAARVAFEPSDGMQNVEREIKPNAMQKEALRSLQSLRAEGKQKALVISATGTGKTYLAAFDVKQAQLGRVLFLVHREQILTKARESFQKIIGFNIEQDSCIYKSGMNVSDKTYVFSTIQTMSREENLTEFNPEEFDYILIDEVHKAGADTYKKVMDYFKPQFLMGMTATPERSDGKSIYELFDYNVAYEIRLKDALDEGLLCPFLYYGVTDIEINGKLVDEDTSFSDLISENRVEHILEKLEYYGHQGETTHGLIFCSRKDEAWELSGLLNARGLRTVALTGEDSQTRREEVVADLEAGRLDYILTVDIFNEGIDIPSVNQVVMLRNTESSIIFIQQLGRGLRKAHAKEYVTVIDFIGNYKNNYLIPVALFGDQSMNRDNYRRDVRESLSLSGLTTVNFEEVARSRIFDSITQAPLTSMKNLRDNFEMLSNRLGRVPYMCDFIENKLMEPMTFFANNALRDYSDVINKFADKSEHVTLSPVAKRCLEFLTFELAPGQRQQDLVLMQMLIHRGGRVTHEEWVTRLKELGVGADEETLRSVMYVLGLTFLKANEVKKYGAVPLVTEADGVYSLNAEVGEELQHSDAFRVLVEDVLKAGRSKYEVYPEVFTLGKKYSRRDVLKLMNMPHDMPPLNVSGYYINKETHSCPIFVTYNKSEDISDTIKYRDGFIDESTLAWESKAGRDLESHDVQTIISSNTNRLRLELFVIKDDNEGGDFYYLGKIHYAEGSARELLQPDTGKKVVGMRFELESPVEPSLYRYITQE